MGNWCLFTISSNFFLVRNSNCQNHFQLPLMHDPQIIHCVTFTDLGFKDRNSSGLMKGENE